MRKAIIVLIGVIVISGVVLLVGWPYVKMEFVNSAHYTEQDIREYEYYTPEILKKIPRVSNNYSFDFSKGPGNDESVFTVHFYEAKDSSIITGYLRSEGYERQKTCDVEAECWRSHKNNDVISVAYFTSPKEIFVQIYRSPYTKSLADSK
ncbi:MULTISPECIES: hypothetical protein [Erwinia]|uniref:Lipoprotein n=1 Tax=Erwinia papayae TaxID=206499 RepID=A0ABV3N1K5_9GAMM|nr:hypothetical protein [Erwinia mallotivora]